MVFVAADTDMPSLRAAAVKPPLSATRVKTARASNLFTVRPQLMWPPGRPVPQLQIMKKYPGIFVDLTGLVSYYTLLALILNAFEVPVPEDGKVPWRK
jgi:hypothetical protein